MLPWIALAASLISPLVAFHLFYSRLRHNDLHHLDVRLDGIERRLSRIEGHLGILG